jgi:hypothetical protein
MRNILIATPLLLCAAPALSQAAAPAQPQIAEVQNVLADPAMADKLANMMQAMSDAFLNLPAGEIQAAVEGRKPTAAEKRMTVRDVARKDDPNFDRDFRQQIAQAKPMIQQSMKALSTALPAMMQGLQQASKAVERAAANMPDPTYPRR